VHRPTKEELRAAAGGTVPDVIAPGLDVLFCGINPGLYSAATRQHFARPGNRFWPALHLCGFTPRQFAPSEAKLLLQLGYGMTMVVRRGTATAAELADEEYKAGGRALVRKINKYKPDVLAVLGVGAYRAAFDKRNAPLGLQQETIGHTALWLLPNPSGLNANYQLGDLVELFSNLRHFVQSRRENRRSA
jgi:TDG/mug DNA glycosylase family protein